MFYLFQELRIISLILFDEQSSKDDLLLIFSRNIGKLEQLYSDIVSLTYLSTFGFLMTHD